MTSTRFLHKYGPWALVTGASDGIGRQLALECAARGLHIVAVARRADKLAELAEEIRQNFGTQVRSLPADLGTPQGLQSLQEATSDLDIGLFIASAGFGTSGPLLSADLAVEQNMLMVNCFALLHSTTIFARRFAQRGRGGIVLMASLVGWQGTPMAAHYAATKAYVQSLAEALRLELAPHNIDVLASAPGPVASGFATRANMRLGLAVTPQVVARQTLGALGRRGTVVPGAFSKLLTWSLLPLPRFLRARIMGLVMSGMTRHQVPLRT